MNEVAKKLLLVGRRFMLELHLRQPGLTYSPFELFTKHDERIQKFRETVDLKHIYKNELDKSCFAHDAAYVNSYHFRKEFER